MTYKTEFPNFDYELPDLGKGWEDNSWHNDISPSLDYSLGEDRILRIWFDYADPDKRECGGKRYALGIGEYSVMENLMESDDLAEILAYVEANRLTHLFEITWGDGYANPGTKIVSMDLLTEDNGWDDWSLELINDLPIGRNADCSDPGGKVIVKRIS